MTHLTWEELNDYADGSMAPGARSAAAGHLDSCGECRDTVARLRSLLATAKSAPASIEPPAEAWGAIRDTIERSKLTALPNATHPARYSRFFRYAAAAVVLIVASSVTTLLLMRQHDTVIALPGAVASAPHTDSVVLPVSLSNMERGYLKTVDDLTATLNRSRAQLAPETVRAVEHSLRIIDDAIAEARAALARDPSNPLLRDFLTKHYEQKVDFLRRVSGRTT